MSKQRVMSALSQFDQRLQNRLEAVLDGMPVAVSWADLKNEEIVFQNKKFREMFGYQLGDHKTVTEWIQKTYINPEHVDRAMQMWAPHFETSSIVPIEIDQVEVDVLCRDGTVKTTLLGGVILPGEGWALAIFTDITERKEQEKLIQKQALEDDLTGVPNRRAFNETLKRSLSRSRRKKKSAGLLLIDLDGFKALNDTHGHKVGDIALQMIAERLNRGVRTEDFVARLGGDEFAVIVDSMDNVKIVEDVANRILAEVHKPIRMEGREIPLDLSIGIAVFPADAVDGEELYRAADRALYRAKKAGRGHWSR